MSISSQPPNPSHETAPGASGGLPDSSCSGGASSGPFSGLSGPSGPSGPSGSASGPGNGPDGGGTGGGGAAGTASGHLHATAAAFCLTAGFWMMVATFMGLLGATELIAPDLTENIGWLVFGRVRPVHINLVLFGFVTPGLLGAAFYYLPRLLRAELFSEKLGVFTAIFWNLTLVAVVASLLAGLTQGREYAEMIWPVDLMVVASFLLVFYNLLMTLRQRREPVLYVSVWYVFAGVALTAVTYCLGNVIWRPSTGALTGIPDAILLWFYGHNIFGLLLTPLALGVTYYVVPKAVDRPLYSHTLSLIGFWSLLVVYTHIGTHHLLQVPAPTWLKVIAIVDSVGMVIPVMVVLINIWFTARGRLGHIHADVGAKFVFAGTIMYFFVSIQGSMMALPQVQRVTHFNNWVVGHAHIGVFGFAGMISLGGLYFVLPRIAGKPLFSRFLADFQYWMVLIGVTGFTIVLTIAGLIQGNAWLNGETVYRVLPEIHMYYVLRASLGTLIFVSACLGFYNIVRTLYFNPGNLYAGNLDPGKLNPGNLNPGNLDSGNLNSGHFIPGEASS